MAVRLTGLSPVIPTIVDKWPLCVEIIPISYFRVTQRHNSVVASLLLIVSLVVASAPLYWRSACAGPKSSSGEFRVGLVTPGSIDDAAWNSGAYRGLQQIRDSLHVRIISQVEAQTPSEQGGGASDLCRPRLQSGLRPRLSNSRASLNGSRPNTSKTVFHRDLGRAGERQRFTAHFSVVRRPAISAGLGGGGMTKTGSIGFVGGIELAANQGGGKRLRCRCRRQCDHRS